MVDSAAEARLRAKARAKTAAAIKPDADPLAALQASVAESKTQVGNKNLEIATIALKKALNAADPENLTQANLDAISQAVTKANVAARSVSPTENYTGRGISTDPLKLNSAIFTGTRNGIEYKNGVALNMSRADILEADRNAAEAAETANRAKTEGLLNPTVRPAGRIDKDMILYYSWVGGRTDGKWQSYRATATEENLEKYGSRVFGGQTQATFESIQGVNALIKQPLPFFKDSPDGKSKKFVGYQLDGLAFTGKGYSTTKEALDAVSSSSFTDSTFQFTGSASTTTASTTTDSFVAPDGRIFTDLNTYNTYIAQTKADEKRRAGQSAYDLLFSEFDRYGMGALIDPLKGFIQDGLSEAEFTLRLRDTDAYKKRFAANAQRIQKGLRAISEAEYIGLEDAYQETMRAYGLPASYYAKGDMGRQEGFEKLIGGGVAPTELEYRIQTAYDRVINANPEVSKALREFYPDISNGDVLAFVLDPENARDVIKRKVTAAEIGAGAMQAGLTTGLARAEELQRYGVTKETAQQGFGTIASGLERGRQLSQIYNQPDYTQAVAEAEVFALPDAEKARRQRRKLGQLETTTFSGTSGVTGGALSRERAGQY